MYIGVCINVEEQVTCNVLYNYIDTKRLLNNNEECKNFIFFNSHRCNFSNDY